MLECVSNLRQQNLTAYGWTPISTTPEEDEGVHGNNERITLKNVREATKEFYEVVSRISPFRFSPLSIIGYRNNKNMPKDAHEMTKAELHKRVVTLGFDGDERLFIAFYRKLQQGLPKGTGIVLRGSVVTNKRHDDGQPFDSQGKGTSDLDVTLVGKKIMEAWSADAYYIPGLHTKPLCDSDPEIAPSLNPLREGLQKLVGRAVNIQATSSMVLYARDVLFGESYFVVVEPEEGA